MPNQTEDDLLTTEEVAAMFRTTPATMHSRRHRGQPMPPGVKFGRRTLYRRSVVEQFLRQHEERPTDDVARS